MKTHKQVVAGGVGGHLLRMTDTLIPHGFRSLQESHPEGLTVYSLHSR